MVVSDEDGPPAAAGRHRRPAPLTPEDVLRIASYKHRSPARQAMVIAFTYNRLAGDLGHRLGRDDNNWYCFATWSSKTVGENLDLGADRPFWNAAGARLKVPGRYRRLFRAIMDFLLGPSYRMGLAMANRAIFLETGSLAADLWEAAADYSYKVRAPGQPGLPDRSVREEVRRPEFLSSLLAPADDTYLDMAAGLLKKAAREPNPAARAELILGASISLSAYEQARAQIALELVLYRPVRWLLRLSWRWALSAVTRRPLRRLRLFAAPHAEQPWLVRHVEGLWARLYTRFLLTLRTPVGEIRLGKPLHGPAAAPIQDAQVRKLVETFIPDPDRATDRVRDWLDYKERMRFIVGYFRAFQNVHEFFDPPFDPPASEELAREMAVGEIPQPEYSEWLRKKVERYEERTRRRGVRGLMVRVLYRSPVAADPDAAELAQLDLGDLLEERRLQPPP